jgi:hypothetical protein
MADAEMTCKLKGVLQFLRDNQFSQVRNDREFGP